MAALKVDHREAYPRCLWISVFASLLGAFQFGKKRYNIPHARPGLLSQWLSCSGTRPVYAQAAWQNALPVKSPPLAPFLHRLSSRRVEHLIDFYSQGPTLSSRRCAEFCCSSGKSTRDMPLTINSSCWGSCPGSQWCRSSLLQVLTSRSLISCLHRPRVIHIRVLCMTLQQKHRDSSYWCQLAVTAPVAAHMPEYRQFEGCLPCAHPT